MKHTSLHKKKEEKRLQTIANNNEQRIYIMKMKKKLMCSTNVEKKSMAINDMKHWNKVPEWREEEEEKEKK